MKKFLVLILAGVVAICASFSAMAASTPTGGSFSVTYNVQSSYLINLPDITLTDENLTFEITADYVHIAPETDLLVLVDTERTFDNGMFYLYKDGSTDTSKAIPCDINVESVSTEYIDTYRSYTLTSTKSTPQIAHFGSETICPEGYGRLIFTPKVSVNNTYGSYTGTIYYTFLIQ